jgi:hypothetical protein
MNAVTGWLRQPTTLMAAGIAVGGVVYWFTGSAPVAIGAATVVLGSVSDHTKDLLTRIEGVEDALKQPK